MSEKMKSEYKSHIWISFLPPILYAEFFVTSWLLVFLCGEFCVRVDLYTSWSVYDVTRHRSCAFRQIRQTSGHFPQNSALSEHRKRKLLKVFILGNITNTTIWHGRVCHALFLSLCFVIESTRCLERMGWFTPDHPPTRRTGATISVSALILSSTPSQRRNHRQRSTAWLTFPRIMAASTAPPTATTQRSRTALWAWPAESVRSLRKPWWPRDTERPGYWSCPHRRCILEPIRRRTTTQSRS